MPLPFTTTTTTVSIDNYERVPSDPNQTEFSMGLEEQQVKPEGRKGDSTAWYLAFTSATVILTVTWSLVLKDGPTSYNWFTFHPLLMSLGMLFLTSGILTLQPTSQPKTKADGLARHQFTILYFTLPSITLGALAIIYRKYLNSANHFSTWHATFGLTTVLYMLIQVLVGGGSVWYGGSFFGGGAKAKAIWKYHRLSGYTLFTILLLTIHLGGGWSSWSLSNSNPFVRLIAYNIAPAVLLGSVFSRIRSSKMKLF